MLSRAGSAVQMPETSGCTSLSKASRPRRRTANDSRLSSAAVEVGTKRSSITRSFPAGVRSDDFRMLERRPGTIRRKPAGTACSRPRPSTRARRALACTGRISASSPSRCTVSRASGRVVRKLSADRSTSQPSWRTVSTTPPPLPAASTIVVCQPSLAISSAAASPDNPAPITTQRGAWEGSGDGITACLLRQMANPPLYLMHAA